MAAQIRVGSREGQVSGLPRSARAAKRPPIASLASNHFTAAIDGKDMETAMQGFVVKGRVLVCVALLGTMAAPAGALVTFPRTVSIDSATIDPVQGSTTMANIRFNPGVDAGPTYQIRTRLVVPGFPVDVAVQSISAGTICTAHTVFPSLAEREWHVDVVAVKTRCSGIACLVPSPFGNEALCQVNFTATQFISPGQLVLALDENQTTCDDEWVNVASPVAKADVTCGTSNGALTVRGAAFGSSPSIGETISFESVTTSTPRTRDLSLVNTGSYQTEVQLSGLDVPLIVVPQSLVVPAGDDFVVDLACAAPAPQVDGNGVVTDIEQVLTAAISHDPNRTEATYTVRCNRIAPPIDLDPFASAPTADGASQSAAMSADGRRLIFESVATNLLNTLDDDAHPDVFLFDAPTGEIQAASVDTDEAPVTGVVMEPAVSAQGDLVAFVASDAGVKRLLGEGKRQREQRRKTTGFGLYLRDLISGTTQRIGGATQTGAGTAPRFAPNGSSLVFTRPVTSSMEGVPGQNNVYQLKLPRIGGIPQAGQLNCLSCKVADGGGAKTTVNANGASGNPVVSADGQWVAWQTEASNSVLGQTPLCGNTQVVLQNVITGVTQRMSSPTTASQCALGGSRKPSIDFSGRKLVFESDLPLGDGDSSAPGTHAYYVDLAGSAPAPVRISTTASGQLGDGPVNAPVISGDGETIAYSSTSSNLDAHGLTGGNGKVQVHVASLSGGKVRSVMRISRAATSGLLGDGDSQRIALDYSGRRVAYDSAAENLGEDAAPQALDVFVQDNPLNLGKVFRAGFE